MNPQQMTDAEIDAALVEHDRLIDKSLLSWPACGKRRTAQAVREFTDNELDAALAEWDKADNASQA